LVEVVEADLGPGLELVAASAELGGGEEGEVGDQGFVFFDGGVVEVEDVDDAEMDLAYVVGVVVEKGYDAVAEGGGDFELFAGLAADALEVGGVVEGEEAFVLVVHVAADADGAFADEALLAALFAADVMEDGAAVEEEDVGDDLLEGGVGLGGSAGGEEVILAGEEDGEVTVYLEVEAVPDGAEGFEGLAADDEDVFFFHRGRECLGWEGRCRGEWGMGNGDFGLRILDCVRQRTDQSLG